jgi:MFS superfamily sulfate permease-like transporter
MIRAEGRVFFLNVGRITERIGAIVREARPRVVVLDCSAIFDLEYTALKAMIEDEERLRREGIALALAALNPQARAMVERSPLGATLGRERMFFNLEQAVEKYATLRPPAEKD